MTVYGKKAGTTHFVFKQKGNTSVASREVLFTVTVSDDASSEAEIKYSDGTASSGTTISIGSSSTTPANGVVQTSAASNSSENSSTASSSAESSATASTDKIAQTSDLNLFFIGACVPMIAAGLLYRFVQRRRR